MTVEAENEVIGQTLALYTEQFHDAPNITNLTTALLTPFVALKDALNELYEDRWLSTSEGRQLDLIGEILGLERRGRTDEEYRFLLRFQIFINISKTEPETLITATRVLSGGDFIRYWEHHPAAGFQLFTNGPNVIDISGSSNQFKLLETNGELYESNDEANILLKTIFRDPDSLVSFLGDIAAAGTDYVSLVFSLGNWPLFGFGSEFETGLLITDDGGYLALDDTGHLELSLTDVGASPDGFLGFGELSYLGLETHSGLPIGVKVGGEVVQLYVNYFGQQTGGGKFAEGTRDYD